MITRLIYITIIAALHFSCSTGSSHVASSEAINEDTLTVDDIVESGDDSVASEEGFGENVLVEEINAKIDSVSSSYSDKGFYTIYSSFSGYESGAEGKWVVDEDLQLQYCEISWSMEGTSGSQTYYFFEDDVLAGEEETFYNAYEENVKIYNHVGSAYGFSRTNGLETDSIINIIAEDDYVNKNEGVLEEFGRLLGRIVELQDSVIENENDVSIHSERIVNYGEDFTESEDYRINKMIFKNILIVKDN